MIYGIANQSPSVSSCFRNDCLKKLHDNARDWGVNQRWREGGTEGGREGGRKGGKKGGREGGREERMFCTDAQLSFGCICFY